MSDCENTMADKASGEVFSCWEHAPATKWCQACRATNHDDWVEAMAREAEEAARQLADAIQDRTSGQRGITLECPECQTRWEVWPAINMPLQLCPNRACRKRASDLQMLGLEEGVSE